MDKNTFIQILKNHGMRPVKSKIPEWKDWDNYDNAKQIIIKILEKQSGNENNYDQMTDWAIEWLGV